MRARSASVPLAATLLRASPSHRSIGPARGTALRSCHQHKSMRLWSRSSRASLTTPRYVGQCAAPAFQDLAPWPAHVCDPLPACSVLRRDPGSLVSRHFVLSQLVGDRLQAVGRRREPILRRSKLDPFLGLGADSDINALPGRPVTSASTPAF